jgi:hypothetical protein
VPEVSVIAAATLARICRDAGDRRCRRTGPVRHDDGEAVPDRYDTAVLTQGVRVMDDLSEVNEWLSAFDVTMFRGDDGKYRIWGHINRIQNIVDSPGAAILPPGATGDLHEFFTNEVDGKWNEIFMRMGFRPVNDPVIGPPEERRTGRVSGSTPASRRRTTTSGGRLSSGRVEQPVPTASPRTHGSAALRAATLERDLPR